MCNCNGVVNIKFAKVKDEATIPSKRLEDAGYDIYACFEEKAMIIPPHATAMIPTGIASALPEEYYFQIQERGSTGTIGMKYGAGVIDSGYRGEWFIPITNTNDKFLIISKDHKNTEDFVNAIYYPYSKAIAQAVLLPVPKTNIEEITYEELQRIPSERGDGIIGSSGK